MVRSLLCAVLVMTIAACGESPPPAPGGEARSGHFDVLQVMADAPLEHRDVKISARLDVPHKVTTQSVWLLTKDAPPQPLVSHASVISPSVFVATASLPAHVYEGFALFRFEGAGADYLFNRPFDLICFAPFEGEFSQLTLRCDYGSTAAYVLAQASFPDRFVRPFPDYAVVERLNHYRDHGNDGTFQHLAGLLGLIYLTLQDHPDETGLMPTTASESNVMTTYVSMAHDLVTILSERQLIALDDVERQFSSRFPQIHDPGYKIFRGFDQFVDLVAPSLPHVLADKRMLSEFFRGASPFVYNEHHAYRLPWVSSDDASGTIEVAPWPWTHAVDLLVNGKVVSSTQVGELVWPDGVTEVQLRPVGIKGDFLPTVLQRGRQP